MEWRQPTSHEKALIDLLLTAMFSGRDVIKKQLCNAMVRTVDAEGSLAFKISSPEKATVNHRIPIEAEATDIDGVTIHMLLHVVEGKVTELEFYKEDSSPILKIPSQNQWRIVNLHG